MKKRAPKFDTLVQFTGMITVIIGMVYEFFTSESLGLILITSGSVAFAVGTKIKGR